MGIPSNFHETLIFNIFNNSNYSFKLGPFIFETDFIPTFVLLYYEAQTW